MNMRQTVTEMEGALRAAGHSVDAFCGRARISRATWTRWKAEKITPNMETWTRAREAFEDMTSGGIAAG